MCEALSTGSMLQAWRLPRDSQAVQPHFPAPQAYSVGGELHCNPDASLLSSPNGFQQWVFFNVCIMGGPSCSLDPNVGAGFHLTPPSHL